MDVAKGLMELALSGNGVALINADDFTRKLFCEFGDGFIWEGRICDRKWKLFEKPHTSYAVCHVDRSGKIRELRLHRLVMCARGGDLIDHVDGNGLHNWRTNLRFSTTKDNSANMVSQRTSSSRFKGVGWNVKCRKWEAGIRVDGKKRHLGLFVDESEAARAYDLAALSAFGSSACLNFPELHQVASNN